MNLGVSLKDFFRKISMSTRRQLQMQKKAVGELIALGSTLVLPLNIQPAWVTFTVLLGWKIGMSIIKKQTKLYHR